MKVEHAQNYPMGVTSAVVFVDSQERIVDKVSALDV